MRALVFNGELQYRTDYPEPQIRHDEALIKITHAGICNTDLEIIKGYMGFTGVPGHEFVGMVEKCSDKNLIGKRVVGEINLGCGVCSYCKRRMQNHCPDRSVMGILNKDGAFAEYATLHVGNLYGIPDTVSDEDAVFVEPLAAAFEILEQVNIKPEDNVCVLGDGKLGLLVAQVVAATGCNLLAVGNHREKLSILERSNIRTALSSVCEEKDFDIAIDCTGSMSGIEAALAIVRPKGKVVMKTTIAERGQLDLNSVVVNELFLIGSRCGPFPAAIKAIESGLINIRSLISKIFPLEDGIKSFQYASKREVLKVILKVA